jgi:hypothetical protein
MNYLGNGDPYSGLQITNVSLPDGIVNVSYSQTLSAVGGTSPYTWFEIYGMLPSGLSLNTTGVISGIPTTIGIYNFLVQVVDSATTPAIVIKNFSISINIQSSSLTNSQSIGGKGGGEGGGEGGSGGGCFIATAAYGSPMAKEVQILRVFRDKKLLTNRFGRTLVEVYYRNSLPVAEYIKNNKLAKKIVRIMLKPVIWSISHCK